MSTCDLQSLSIEDRFTNLSGFQELLTRINKFGSVKFETAVLAKETELQIECALALILKKYEHEHLLSSIYTSLKEILVNATRSNAKQAWFKEQELDINNPEQYKKGTKIIKDLLSETWIQKYGKLAKDLGLTARLELNHSEDGIRLEVNNVALQPEEEIRIREKLSKGMQYDDLLSFYIDNADSTEGEGMGLALILVLLKSENIDPNLFRMGVVGDQTFSRLEIPLTENFVSVRGQNPAGKT